ncbi:MAG: GGDEF domain-containing protein [Turicibacter sp.]
MTLLEEVHKRMSLFNKMFDKIRVVDPVEKKVVQEDREDSIMINQKVRSSNCFNFWESNSMCKNCVSYQAYKENKSFVKVERGTDGYYWTVATPVEYEGKRYIVEFLKKMGEQDCIVDQDYDSVISMDTSLFDLAELAHKDSLTQIYNRRYLNERLEKDLFISQFHQHHLSILMLDIDYFKQINDTFGHLYGDEVLVDFATYIKSLLRKDIDWISRFGGEEFVVVLNRTSYEQAHAIAQRIRKKIEDHTFTANSHPLKLTCSIGVATSQSGERNFHDLLNVVDKNVYVAKYNGRNRVV